MAERFWGSLPVWTLVEEKPFEVTDGQLKCSWHSNLKQLQHWAFTLLVKAEHFQKVPLNTGLQQTCVPYSMTQLHHPCFLANKRICGKLCATACPGTSVARSCMVSSLQDRTPDEELQKVCAKAGQSPRNGRVKFLLVSPEWGQAFHSLIQVSIVES